MKVCTKCNTPKEISEFHRDKSKRDGLREQCKECRCKLPAIVHKNCVACGDMFEADGNAKSRKYCGPTCQTLHLRYGIDEYRYEDLLISQNYCCAICKQPETAVDRRTGKLYDLAVDHCHETGNVRGLLCAKCNGGLGQFQDNRDLLKSALNYLEYHESEIKLLPERPQYKNKYRRA